MNTLRYLIAILLFSAVAASAAAPAGKAVDGYQASSSSVAFAFHNQEHESDEPEGTLLPADIRTWLQRSGRIGHPRSTVGVACCADYLVRAPPQLLKIQA